MPPTALCTSPPPGGGVAHPPPLDPILLAYAGLLESMRTSGPRPLPLCPRAGDIEDRLDHLDGVLGGVSWYLRQVLADTAQNVPGGLALAPVEALLADLLSEVTGLLRQAASSLPGSLL